MLSILRNLWESRCTDSDPPVPWYRPVLKMVEQVQEEVVKEENRDYIILGRSRTSEIVLI